MSEQWKKIPKKIQDIILYGSDEEEIRFSYDDGYETYSTKKTFEGVINNLERRYLETDSEWKREEISQYQSETDCEKCKGMRLKDEALCVKINDLNIQGIVCGGIDYQTLTKILKKPLGVAITGMEDTTTIIVTEGFGEISMADRTYQLFKENTSEMASINGATQIRAGVMRPEIFIGSTDKSIVEDSFNEDKLAISIGSKVRIIREPFFGLIGEVIELPKELVTIDTETTSRVAKIKLNDARCEIIPRANLEVILLD